MQSKSLGKWTREQTILAFYFYCQIPFGQIHARNPKIIAAARTIGRSPGALTMKCGNLASIDPQMQASGRVGLSNASMLDKSIWQEFSQDWEKLVEQAHSLLIQNGHSIHFLVENDDGAEDDYSARNRTTVVQQRQKQAFFRQCILSGYGGKCCISGVSDARFLIASHIVAWKDDASIRLHPGNGLCLSVLHDKAFDQHLFSLSDRWEIVLSLSLKNTKDKFLKDVFWPLEGQRIALPEKFVPEISFIQRHRAIMENQLQHRL